MDQVPRLLSCHPPRAGHSRTPVDRHGNFVGDERATNRHPCPPRLELLAAAEAELTVGNLDLDSRLSQQLDAAAHDVRIRVALANDDVRNARGDHRGGARRRRALVRTRLEGDVEGCAARELACGRESVHLGVGGTPSLVPTLADDLAAPGDDNGADHGVRMRGRPPSLGELHRAFEHHARSLATKKPAVPWTCGSVCRNSGRCGWRNPDHSSPSVGSTSRPDASTTASHSSRLIVHTE